MMSTEALPIGNFENKYEARNPIARRLVNGFLTAFDDLIALTQPGSIHEVGCGEGMLTQRLAKTSADKIKGSDIDEAVFSASRASLAGERFSFQEKSIYDLTPASDSADLVVCCEVLEHLEDPKAGLESLWHLDAQHYVFSVPREPVWRFMNLCRGKYVSDLGNTPGHLQHWSGRGFYRFLSQRFEIVEMRSPLPWTMALCKRRQISS